MSNFYQTQEEKDFARIQEINDQLNFFSYLAQTPELTKYDISGKTKDNRNFIGEIKDRSKSKKSLDECDDIMIEPHKLQILSGAVDNGDVGLYINYDNDVFYLFSIVDGMNPRFADKVLIWDKGARKYKEQPRYFLDKNLAIKYKRDKDGRYRRYK